MLDVFKKDVFVECEGNVCVFGDDSVFQHVSPLSSLKCKKQKKYYFGTHLFHLRVNATNLWMK